jgi:acyl-CoA synthetase (AMP-forming)/AMP-acid ligase II
MYAGRRIVPLARFSAEDWLAAARREQVTHAFVVPTMLARIVVAMEADPDARVPSLRTLSYGGARMPLPVLERALDLFPDAGFVNAYGLTETSSTVALLGPDEHRQAVASDDPSVRSRLGSVGRPIEGIEVDVADDNGAPLPAGERGRVRIRGPQVSGAYLDVDAGGGGADAGWLVTGDIGWVDGDGYLFLAGRADDVIIAGGENISPGEIEDALLRHPDVSGAAVVGVPDDEWGERVAAAVTVVAGATIDTNALAEWMRTEVGGLKAPKLIVVEEELPVTATGKILRREIKEKLAALSR